MFDSYDDVDNEIEVTLGDVMDAEEIDENANDFCDRCLNGCNYCLMLEM